MFNSVFKQIHHISMISHRYRPLLFHSHFGKTERFRNIICDFRYPTLILTGHYTGKIHLRYDCSRTCDFSSLGLSTTHASESGGYKQVSAKITVLWHSKFHTAGIQESIECAMHDSLRPYIHPASGCHLTVIGNTHLHGFMPVVRIIKKSHHHCIGYYNPWRIFLRRE